ncbi:MvdC/MvdD family ATP grasp protein [Rivibacter subsaxonicus]|uniref:RimK-like ATP-grasp domain-containing protein n=1 Tax=Rivibacter subsaxonicus TaxID=457575 RepID=A0A4Q7VVE7_9BURK|nr:alpha-L-glutamate ligase [Rivibacter subsaxonicus]RZU00637.1 RimK-like ATP-grasp domain-containing protein [Rivibacter subsaxonicus]
MILVISHHRDEHAQSVMVELSRRGVATRLLDLSRFPLQLGLSMRYDGHGGSRFVFGCDDSGLELDDCGAIWWRRPQPPSVEGEVHRPAHQHFALSESHEALHGLWQSVDAFWINEPARDAVAARKAWQLELAGRIGLELPQTLITNCPQAAREFLGRVGLGNVIYKAFSATEQDWRETRLVRADELDRLDNLRYAPVIFQRYIEATVDLRITVVGERLFPAAIHSQDSDYKIDFRMDIGRARIEPVSLPADVEAKLLELMRRLGLAYGAIDMRRRPDGSHVFLEINPAGQWLFIERQTGQPISAALAELLQRHDGQA